MSLARKPIRRANFERRDRLYRRNVRGPWPDWDHGAFVRAQLCAFRGYTPCNGPIEAAHIRARGMGGVKSSWREQVPLCRHHHGWYDSHPSGCYNRPGLAVQKTGVDLERTAERLVEIAEDLNGGAQ